jgi:hypothetical protein
MKQVILSIAVFSLVLFAGCRERFLEPDFISPAAPQGLVTQAGDRLVDLFWYPNTEPDLAGYKVYYSSSYNGTYHLIGTTSHTSFTDRDARNGSTYFYAVTAFDASGNESELTPELVKVTPRPEGYDIVLDDYRTVPARAGYDFSSATVGPYDDQYTDLFFESYNGRLYFDVWDDSEIQDAGYTGSLADVVEAPATGWSPTGDVYVIAGHTYVIRTWDRHYAKVRVTAVSSSGVSFDWAYQLQSDNPQLKTVVIDGRKGLNPGTGLRNR